MFQGEDGQADMVKGLGVDMVEIARMDKILRGPASQRFLERVYTPFEIRHCRKKAKSAQHFAARFAAKEAVFKALGTGWAKGVGWKDVEVRNDASGVPRVILYGMAEEIFQGQGAGRMLLSLSHTSQAAIAQALWVSDGISRSGLVLDGL
jgi:holo-[acyl-carrier protein] synthase